MARESPFAVRMGTKEDADSMARLLIDFNREFNEPTPPPAALSERIRLLLEDGDTRILLVGSDPVGVAVLRFRRSIWSEGLECYLAELYVIPSMRGQGIGRQLLGEAMNVARLHGADTMDVGVDEPDVAARSLYESAGFSHRVGGPDGPVMFVYERDL